MNTITIIIGVIFVLALTFILMIVFGSTFREWNEGVDNVKNNKKSNTKTLIIGFAILIVMVFFYRNVKDKIKLYNI